MKCFDLLEKPWCLKCILVFFCVFCTINCYFEYGIQICVFFCVWEHNLKILLNSCFKHFQNCPRSVNNFRTNYCLILFEICRPKWSPYVAEASLGRVKIYKKKNDMKKKRNVSQFGPGAENNFIKHVGSGKGYPRPGGEGGTSASVICVLSLKNWNGMEMGQACYKQKT